jgi:hypothetical protein
MRFKWDHKDPKYKLLLHKHELYNYRLVGKHISGPSKVWEIKPPREKILAYQLL